MWEQIRANRIKAFFLVALMALLLAAVGFAVGGPAGLAIAGGLWLILFLVSFYGGGDIFLAMSGAKKIERKDHPRLWNVVEEMTIAGGLPKMPDVYIIDDRSPNAFATGRDPNHSAVAVTSGLLSRLNRDELQGVIAHEISHVKNRDILLMVIVGVMMGTIVLIADATRRMMFYSGRSRRSSRDGGQGAAIMALIALVLIILAPIFAQLIYFALSRKREYLADASGATLTRYPEGLASALEKISSAAIPLSNVDRVTAPMYIANPMELGRAEASSLTSTHPPIARRVGILRSMGTGASYNDYQNAFRKVCGEGSSIIPSSSLKAAKPLEVRQAVEEKESPTDRLYRARETSNMLWAMNNYLFITCPCGLKLKIPPEFRMKSVACPSCGKSHEVTGNQ